nr:response regulator [Lachnospiraceae bacterium]
ETMLSGFEIIDAIKAGNSYDLIFMDHMMPEMDGVETVKKIRVLNVGNSGAVPIVALTANAVKGVEAEFLEAGMNDALFKPVVIDDLKRILIKWLPKN